MSRDDTRFVTCLPDLRRYARLLTGQQAIGDILVISSLQWIANDPPPMTSSHDDRVQLYRVLTRLWRSPVGGHLAGLMPGGANGNEVDDVDYRLAAMVSVERAAFLLVSVESFSHSEGAKILDATPGEFATMLETAHAAISRHLATDVLIIEDELLIAFELENLMTKLGHRVTSVVRTHRMAVKKARIQRPWLILADVHLADGSSGIDAVNEIIEEIDVPVVFITAYPERLLTGLCPEPTFLVTKPFRTEEVQAVVGQALFFDASARYGISRRLAGE